MRSCQTIPARSNFYSIIKEETITQDEYNFAANVWSQFDCENLLEYAELYCAIDTLLLAEVITKNIA